MTTQPAEPKIRTVQRDSVLATPLAAVGVQQVLLGAARADGSPLLLGVTQVRGGLTSPMIQHDTAEVAYVLSGEGWMVTDNSEHPFTPGDAILIEARCWHAIRAGQDPVEMLYVFPAANPPATRDYPSSQS